jgi:FAD binding domain
MFLVHFKSRDLAKLHKQGQFWHIFFTTGAFILSQDEVDTWTTHLPIPLDADWEKMDPKEAIYKVLGGVVGPFPIEVDEILVKSAWRPNISIADKYASESRRIFLSGDSAHQNIPTGGYGMNTAVGDSFDIGWKIAAVLKGYGGRTLLDSYEIERMPVGIRNIDRSGFHFNVHGAYNDWVRAAGGHTLISNSPEGKELRERIKSQVTVHDGENKDHGIEMGYRYNGSPVIIQDPEDKEPEWSVRQYVPSTWPGARAPSVFLADGETNIYDLFGRDYTIVDFTDGGSISQAFIDQAATLKLPLTRLHLPSEEHVQYIWERSVVLVRPDNHVAWRAPKDLGAPIDIEQILKTVSGQLTGDEGSKNETLKAVLENGFTGTVGNQDHNEIQMLAAFQQ